MFRHKSDTKSDIAARKAHFRHVYKCFKFRKNGHLQQSASGRLVEAAGITRFLPVLNEIRCRNLLFKIDLRQITPAIKSLLIGTFRLL